MRKPILAVTETDCDLFTILNRARVVLERAGRGEEVSELLYKCMTRMSYEGALQLLKTKFEVIDA